MESPTISLCMIVKDEVEELKRCLDSAAPYVDEIILVETDPEADHDWTIQYADQKTAISCYPFKWINDFSAARNFSFSKATGDYILWLDADDVLQGGEHLLEAIDYMKRNNYAWLAFNYQYAQDVAGIGIANHLKPRLILNDGNSTWKKPIHENLEYSGFYSWDKYKTIQVIHHLDPEKAIEKQLRNIAILEEEFVRDGTETDPRTLHYLGNSYLGIGMALVGRNMDGKEALDNAIYFYTEHTKRSGWDEETYFSYVGIGQALSGQDRSPEAISAFLRAVETRPDWSDAYWFLTIVYNDLKQYKKSIEFGEIALSKKKPETILAVNDSLHKFVAPSFLVQSYLLTNNVDKALRLAKAVYDGSERATELLTMAGQAYDLEQYVQTTIDFFNKTAQYDPNSLPKIAEAMPDLLLEDVRMQELRMTHAPAKTWDSNTVVFFCGKTAEEWSDHSVMTGIGGSEEATIYTARELAKLGYTVTVFNHCGTFKGEYNGVIYRPYWEFNPRDTFNWLILWRNAQISLAVEHARHLWVILHDKPDSSWFNESIIDRVERFVFLSQWQRNCVPEIPDDKVLISRNGLNLDNLGEVFKGTKRNPHKIIWSSSYDRGLKYILERWPRIRKAVPDATLEPLYGWETFDAIRGNDPKAMAWKQEMLGLLDQPGIGKARRVGKQELAQHFAEAAVWTYPTDFWEISCITAMRAQALGAIPVCSDYAALGETVQFGIKVPGVTEQGEMPDKVADKIVDQTIRLLKSDKETQDAIRKPMMAWAQKHYTWEAVAKQWTENL